MIAASSADAFSSWLHREVLSSSAVSQAHKLEEAVELEEREHCSPRPWAALARCCAA
jgi:hypothetical protein